MTTRAKRVRERLALKMIKHSSEMARQTTILLDDKSEQAIVMDMFVESLLEELENDKSDN